MNEELLQLYIEGLVANSFKLESSIGGGSINWGGKVRILEKELGRKSNAQRKQNPEFQKALEVLESPLMKALK